MTEPASGLAFAFGDPCVTGLIKQRPQDFRVDEIPGFEPEGKGDHVFLTIEKTGLTTNSVANTLRQFCGLKHRDVGYAGMKDKHAVTTQQFSLDMSGRTEPEWSEIETDSLRIIRVSRHKRKLKRGVLKGNRFVIRIVDLQGDRLVLEQRLNQIKNHGVPNYFGQQRFGRNGSNIELARKLFDNETGRMKRDEKSILLSSVRSLLFNAVLNERVKQQNWFKLLEGEVINLDGTERHFSETIDEVLTRRAEEMDVHPTGPLYGLPSRALQPTGQAGEIEKKLLDQYESWKAGLERFGLEHARRPLRIAVRDMQWTTASDEMTISFSLTSGAYATVVLREFLEEVVQKPA